MQQHPGGQATAPERQVAQLGHDHPGNHGQQEQGVARVAGQGMEAVQAAATAVWAHGTAGDFAALAESQTSLSATSLAAQLGVVFQMIERKPA
mgnify:CR=1 FL=1